MPKKLNMKEKLIHVQVLLPEKVVKIIRNRANDTRTPVSTYLRNIIIKNEIQENEYGVKAINC